MDDHITLAHGSGGVKYRELVEEIFLHAFTNDYLSPLTDSAILPGGDILAMTTDSYVVQPLFFPGGDIGSLAISGTVNDLTVSGAIPQYISVGMILEAGLETSLLRSVVNSMAQTAKEAGVYIVTGDTKVIENRGGSDGLFINTAGIGIFPAQRVRPQQIIEPGDKIILSGYIACHGMAVMAKREGFVFAPPIESDAKPLNSLVETVFSQGYPVHAMRDPTRGGVAATLCEWVTEQTDILVEEPCIPLRPDVSAACQLLGLDPLYIANEGIVVFAVPAFCADDVLATIQSHPHGTHAAIIGEALEGSGMVKLKTTLGAQRRIALPRGELLPRIC
jgi:hydrogenase expression/formation protein HypE